MTIIFITSIMPESYTFDGERGYGVSASYIFSPNNGWCNVFNLNSGWNSWARMNYYGSNNWLSLE